MKIRYFFDITELLAAGQTISNVSVAIYYDQEKNLEGAVAVNGPLAWNGSATVYYVEFNWTGYHIWGTRDLEFGLNAAIGPNYLFYWNASNDWSRQGLTATLATTQYIPVYLSGKLVYGQEPPISSSTPTPTPTAGAAAVKAQFFAGDTAATTSTLRPNFQLVNTGSSILNLSTITFRYWYTKDGTPSQTWATDYAQVGAANISASIVSMTSPKATADTYLQIGFTSAAGTLAAGQNSGGIQGRLYKSDYSSYTQTHDWSFNATATSFTDNPKVTVYQSGKLIYGTEPS
jgi:endoglucanase